MRSLVIVLALAFVAGSASASQLDFDRGSLAAGTAQYKDFGSNKTLLSANSSSENNGPIRRRRPYRERERDYGYRSQPTYYAMLGGGTFDPSNQPGNGLYLNGGIGSVLAGQIDMGVQLSWYHRSTGGEQFVQEYDLPDGSHVTRVTTTQSIDTDLVPLMGTLRVRIPVTPQFEPYVGGGVGWEWLSVSGTDDAGFDFQNDYDGFGAQVFGGANLKVANTAGLYGEMVWNASTPKAEFYDPAIGQNVREEADYDGVAFHGGLRFSF